MLAARRLEFVLYCQDIFLVEMLESHQGFLALIDEFF